MPEQHREGRGCVFYGCLTFIIILVALAVGTYFGTRKAVRMAVDMYLDTKPTELPKVQLSEGQRREALTRFERALDSAEEGKGGGTIDLSSDELNVVMRETGVLGPTKEQIYFRIETNQLKADVSMPLDQFEVWRQLGNKLKLANLGGRYLNGTAFLEVQVTNGVMDMKVTDVHVKGKPLPNSFTGQLKTENVAAGANKNAEAQNILKQVEKVEIKDDKVLLHLKEAPKEKTI